jgi:MFS family permease
MSTDFRDNDPLWKLRHALAGVALALMLAVFAAALGGRVLGDAFGDSYGRRVTIYLLLLVYVVAGAGVLFVKVARHETRPLSVGRVATWFASLWVWPLLLAARRGRRD